MKSLKSSLIRLYLQFKKLRKRTRVVGIRFVKFRKRFFKILKGQLITILAILYFAVHFFLRTFKSRVTQQQSPCKLAIIVPNDFSLVTPNFNGGTKDIQSMLEQMCDLGISYEVFSVPRKTTHALYSLLQHPSKFFSSSHTLLSIPGSSGLLVPYLKILGFSHITFRSHNAELLHRLEWIRSSKSIREILKSMKKLFFGFLSDFLVSIFATNILSVSQKEIDIYWSFLFPWSKGKVRFFPGASPSHIREGYLSKQKENRVRAYATIVGGFEAGTVISKADRNFVKHGPKIKNYFNSMNLLLVSVGNKINFDFCDFNYGYVHDYLEVLVNSEIVIVPSSVGWGFKTKIADAVTLHQSVVVTETLYNRLGTWSQMVSPLRDWADISSLKLRFISAKDYQDFLEEISHLRRNILLELFMT